MEVMNIFQAWEKAKPGEVLIFSTISGNYYIRKGKNSDYEIFYDKDSECSETFHKWNPVFYGFWAVKKEGEEK